MSLDNPGATVALFGFDHQVEKIILCPSWKRKPIKIFWYDWLPFSFTFLYLAILYFKTFLDLFLKN
jgi:hypothetical protein